MAVGSIGRNAARPSRTVVGGESPLGANDRVVRRRDDGVRELCHDLLQPVATISAVAAAAQVEADLPSATRARLAQVTLEAKRIAELCQQVLRDQGEHSAVLLDELTAEVAAAASMISDATVSVHAEPTVVEGDSAALRRAIWNLIDNAMRAAGPGGQVKVTVSAVGDRAQIAVADSGGGFGAGQSGVAGLGLRIVARVVQEHGGELSLGRSGDLGGAAVTLSLPSMSNVSLQRRVGEGGSR